VAIWGTNAEKNGAASAALTGPGRRVLVQHCAVADEAAVDGAFAETVKTLGRVDACFVNAGVSGRSAGQGCVDMTTAEWLRMLAVNLDGRRARRHLGPGARRALRRLLHFLTRRHARRSGPRRRGR